MRSNEFFHQYGTIQGISIVHAALIYIFSVILAYFAGFSQHGKSVRRASILMFQLYFFLASQHTEPHGKNICLRLYRVSQLSSRHKQIDDKQLQLLLCQFQMGRLLSVRFCQRLSCSCTHSRHFQHVCFHKSLQDLSFVPGVQQ